MHAKTPLLVTPVMTTLYRELEDSMQRNQSYKTLLQGPNGVGKTTTLLYIGHMARAKGYLVFPIQASFFVNQGKPMSSQITQFLLNWRNAEGEAKLKEIPCIHQQRETLWDLLNQNYQDEKVAMVTFCQLVDELRVCKTKPVIFLIDQCNVFNTNPQKIKL